MSTLTVATIKSNSTSPPAIQNSSGTEIGTLCRAWVNFNGTGTVAIRASFNVSSITDNGTGDYTVNFTNAMPDANYCWGGSAKADGAETTGGTVRMVDDLTYQNSSFCRIRTQGNTTTIFDTDIVSFFVFR